MRSPASAFVSEPVRTVMTSLRRILAIWQIGKAASAASAPVAAVADVIRAAAGTRRRRPVPQTMLANADYYEK